MAAAVVMGVALVAVVPAAPAAELAVSVVSERIALTNPAGSGAAVTARCPSGATLVGGGSSLGRAAGGEPPGNGLKLNASAPAGPSGEAAADGTANPARWSTVSGFGGQAEAGNEARSFAMCATGGPTATVVKTSPVIGTAAEGSAPKKAVATCPPGSRLIGGGTKGTPDTAPGLKPVAGYPSDSEGRPAADGTRNPGSWASFASSGAPVPTDTVIAFALCASSGAPEITVVRMDVAGPTEASGVATATVACPGGTVLLGGGYMVDKASTGAQPHQGVHVRGSYPSDAGGTAVTAGGSQARWTAVTQAGGQAATETTTHAFALCASAETGSPAGSRPTTTTTQHAGAGPATSTTTTAPLGASAGAAATTTTTTPAGETASGTGGTGATTTTTARRRGAAATPVAVGPSGAVSGTEALAGTGPPGLAQALLGVGFALVAVGSVLAMRRHRLDGGRWR